MEAAGRDRVMDSGMNAKDRESAKTRRENVWKLLVDGKWHSTMEINAARVGGSEGCRRLRELRAECKKGKRPGWVRIERRRKVSDSTQCEYKLISRNQLNAINYVSGDATQPVGVGTKLIVHICNDQGAWGKGFVLAITKRFGKTAESKYKEWYRSGDSGFSLGSVQFAKVAEDVIVGNMIAQQGIYPKDGVAPIRYEALTRCLKKVFVYSEKFGLPIHMPRIGAGLAGGSWPKIAAIIDKQLVQRGLSVTVYDWSP
jgi:O-acetyl-ADP-ribose deacetylase (regulator of RNase III)